MVRSLEVLHEEFRRVTPRSLAQWEHSREVLPGGVIKGAYYAAPYPIYIERAQDCYLWDLDGRRYVDFANHHTAMILGHSHPAVVEAVQRELNRGFAFGAPTTLEAEIAEEFKKRFPSIDKVRYANSGTEASISATRMVRAVSGKPMVAKFEGAYHGFNDSLEFNTKPEPDASPGAIAPVPAWNGMPRGAEDNVVVLPMNDRESVDLVLREHRDELAAVFFDGKPGVLDIPLEFGRFLRELTRELGIYLVMDEVISFRAGYGGYQGMCGIEPDLTIFGKLAGGGLPVGAIGGRAELMDVLDNSGPPTGMGQSGTFAGNNFTLAAGLATLRALTPEVYRHLDGLRERLHRGVLEVFQGAGLPCQVVSAGSTVNAYMTDQPITSPRVVAASDRALFERVIMGLLLKGYYARDGMGFVLSAPMSDEHIDSLLEAMDEVVGEDDQP